MKVLAIFGTRPEAVKMCPLIMELKKRAEIECKVCLTGQHREMLDQVMNCFSLQADYNLNIMNANQTLTEITSAILEKLEPVLQTERPHIVLVHGDTTSSFAAALASFYQRIPIGHVEAGLRTGNMYAPFPEEINRCLIGRLAAIHFAPTEGNAENLKKEGVIKPIFVTGNTVIDSFKTTVRKNYTFSEPKLKSLNVTGKRIVLVTAHRRENIGIPLRQICLSLKRIAQNTKDVLVIYPLHLNPKVRGTAIPILNGEKNVVLTEPLGVLDMHNLMAKAYMVMTDSGGLQEEAPALGKPVLVLREETERPEAIEAGTASLAGVEEERIYEIAMKLLDNSAAYEQMAKAVNPYGDGRASERIADILQQIAQKERSIEFG